MLFILITLANEEDGLTKKQSFVGVLERPPMRLLSFTGHNDLLSLSLQGAGNLPITLITAYYVQGRDDLQQPISS